MSDILFALRHKKTGKFLRPGTQPTKEPKLYMKRPSIGWTTWEWDKVTWFHHTPKEWEIVKFTLTEVGTEELK